MSLEKYKKISPDHIYLDDPQKLSSQDRDRILKTGFEAKSTGRSGSFLQMDHSVVHCKAEQEGIEILSTSEAMQKYDWLRNYRWQAMAPEQDDYTRYAREHAQNGYTIRALPGVKSIYPIQSCMYLHEEGLVQAIHNIVIVEEGAELHLITGCTSAPHVKSGMHLGISEFYVKKGARLTFTMIHNWAENMEVRPKSATIVEEGGVFLSNYISLEKVEFLKTYPSTYLVGKNAVARYHTILVSPPGSHMDVGSRVILRAPGTKAELISRTITTGGDIINRGHLVGECDDCKAHLECRGLMLADKGMIWSIPELESRASGADLSHEAAVGKIAPEELEYLMARGLSEEEATAAIVRGFLNVRIEGLPPELQAEIDKAISASQSSFM